MEPSLGTKLIVAAIQLFLTAVVVAGLMLVIYNPKGSTGRRIGFVLMGSVWAVMVGVPLYLTFFPGA